MNLVHCDDRVPVRLATLVPDPEAAACLPESAARRLSVVPMGLKKDRGLITLLVGSNEPDNEIVRERLKRQLPGHVAASFIYVDAEGIEDALNRCYRNQMTAVELIQCCAQDADAHQRRMPSISILLVEALLVDACRRRVSDIHLSPGNNGVQVRLRIDGVLNSLVTLASSLFSGLVVRIKILSGLDIAESRLPQDGQFEQWIDGQRIDFRVSSFPTIMGENLVLRVMSTQSCLRSIEDLKLPVTTISHLHEAMRKPEGLIIVCGPTGSGKTTTLYALINELDKSELNIMTLEDPVEIQTTGIRQTSIDPTHAIDYAQGLRALLRQDPDVLMIGEVRDTDSCLLLLRAVMTGHRVFSTVHSNNALGALDRLVELSSQAALLANHLTLVISQRLIRLICVDCGGGQSTCTACSGTGFCGRQVVMELLRIDAQLATLIAAGAPAWQIHENAIRGGFVSMREQAQSLVEARLTTTEELERVLGGESVVAPVASAAVEQSR